METQKSLEIHTLSLTLSLSVSLSLYFCPKTVKGGPLTFSGNRIVLQPPL